MLVVVQISLLPVTDMHPAEPTEPAVKGSVSAKRDRNTTCGGTIGGIGKHTALTYV